ncbi:hypothetical protein SANTM175S_05540 [Streptomyces antimycoticus]
MRKVLTPLEESVVAARKIKGDWKSLAETIQNSADFDIYDSAEKMLSRPGVLAWGTGRAHGHRGRELDRLIAAYILADLLRIKDFTPTADNMAKLPFGEAGLKAWQAGSRPKFDPPPEIYQEPWLDDSGTGGTQDVPTNPRKRYDGGWEVDGG